MDRISAEQRSKNMAAVKSRGNKSTEQIFLRFLRRHKIVGWRRHYKQLPGTPDFAFPKSRVAVFLDGCFWHGCKRCFKMPKTNRKFWAEKIEGNKKRDRLVSKAIRAKNWSVVRLWEHTLKETRGSDKISVSVIQKVRNG